MNIKNWFNITLLALCLISSGAYAKTNHASDYAANISNTTTDLLEFILKLSPETQNIGKDQITQIKNTFTSELQANFNEKELQEIDSVFQKVGGKNLVKMTQVTIEALTKIIEKKSTLKDFELNISPSYDKLLDSKIGEEKINEKLRQFYIADHAKDKNASNLSADADKFVLIAQKYLKKAISESFTEEQYATYYKFEKSSLGKRYEDIFQKSIAKGLS